MQGNMVGQNIVITERSSTLRQLGRNALRGKWKNGIIAIIIYMICVQVPTIIFNQLFGYNPGNFMASGGYTYNIDPEIYTEFYNQMPHYSLLSCVYLILVAGAFSLGISLFFLASFRGHDVVPKDIFLGFEKFGKALGLIVFQSIFIFLWTLLFIIPGIIAAIRYSQAFFVLADDPEKSIRECMNESKRMMKGNKAKYFWLSLSFIGWFLLASIPGGVVQGIIMAVSDSAMAYGITTLITAIITAPVYTYLYSTMAGFYEILAGHLIKETAPAPVMPEQINVAAPVAVIEDVIEEVNEEEGEKKDGALDKPKESPLLKGPEEPSVPDAPREASQPDVPEAEAADEAAVPEVDDLAALDELVNEAPAPFADEAALAELPDELPLADSPAAMEDAVLTAESEPTSNRSDLDEFAAMANQAPTHEKPDETPNRFGGKEDDI